MRIFRIISLFVLICIAITANAKTLNPKDYGLSGARNGKERFEVLMRCHKDAILRNCTISYKGISEIDLDIPYKAESIPLPVQTDFACVKIVVNNTDRTYVLFRMAGNIKEIPVTGNEIDRGDFRQVEDLKRGYKLLMIEDQNPWVQERLGYQGGGVRRKDILVLKNGMAQNHTVMPYDNVNSSPKAWLCEVTAGKKVVKNLNFVRTETSTAKTYPIAIEYQYNVELSNIITTTPQNTDLVSDSGIMIIHCAKVKVNDVRINGTYSKVNKSGSGMRLINVYDVEINRMYARSAWGVFGNHSVNTVLLRDCDINRFDIHCYGTGVTSVRCKYSGLYNQFSSYYGKLIYKNCTFTDFVPVLIESSYNAYTPFEVEWDGCTINLTKEKNYLLTLFGVKEPINPRPELREKCIPNLTLKNSKIVLSDDVKEWYAVQTGRMAYKGEMGYISTITIRNTQVREATTRSSSIFHRTYP